MKYLFNRMVKNSSVISLVLGSNSVWNRNRIGVEALTEMMNYVKANKVIQFLDLRRMMLRDRGLEMLSKGFTEHSPMLCLNLANSDFTSGSAKHLSRILVSC